MFCVGPKLGLLPTPPNYDQQTLAAQQYMQQMLVAQQQAAAYMAMFQQHQRHYPPLHSDHMMDNQPPPSSSQDQRELGPLHWVSPAPTYPGFPAAAATAMYGGHMQQLFQPATAAAAAFHQPPPPPNEEEGTPGGLFIPPVAPEQQRMMQQQISHNVSSQKQSQAIPIINPKSVSVLPGGLFVAPTLGIYLWPPSWGPFVAPTFGAYWSPLFVTSTWEDTNTAHFSTQKHISDSNITYGYGQYGSDKSIHTCTQHLAPERFANSAVGFLQYCDHLGIKCCSVNIGIKTLAVSINLGTKHVQLVCKSM